MTSQTLPITAVQLQDRLRDLLAERALAAVEGLAGNALYTTALDREITATRAALVGTAVTELATARGELFGRPQG